MENVVNSYERLRILVESLELDVHKSARGNKSAGVRVRKGLRTLKREATDLVRASLEASKSE
mgnify:FL=1|tara:strand:+ start:250 stop:435 length:186 start_codon:yes stop_codon:yes gene_type:complete